MNASPQTPTDAEASDNDAPRLTPHVPVMVEEVMSLLDPKPGELMVDATAGHGGHAKAIGAALGTDGVLVALDRDPRMLDLARDRIAASTRCKVRFVQGNFSRLSDHLVDLALKGVDGVLLDLGLASPQLDDPARGLSYRANGPLDMRMSPGEGDSAATWVNRVPESELADVLWTYGEERYARRIARSIVRARGQQPIRRTVELADLIRRAYPRRPRRLHPARRSFQAIRIFINRELEHLERFLDILPGLLKPAGRCVVISYHSLEDRRVKEAFRRGAREGLYELLTKKPMRPSADETSDNPRSRSARLRALRRTAAAISHEDTKARRPLHPG